MHLDDHQRTLKLWWKDSRTQHIFPPLDMHPPCAKPTSLSQPLVPKWETAEHRFLQKLDMAAHVVLSPLYSNKKASHSNGPSMIICPRLVCQHQRRLSCISRRGWHLITSFRGFFFFLNELLSNNIFYVFM